MSELSTFAYEVVALNPQGEEIKRERLSTQCYQEKLAPDIVLEMVVIPGGTFLMGSPNAEAGWQPSQSPQHLVTLNPFLMARYPITQAQWQAVAKLPQVNQWLNPEPANFIEENRPVEQISWYDAVEFCARLSQYTGREYRLPSEAEWEYACRAVQSPPTHTSTSLSASLSNGGEYPPFHFGETITTDLANYSGVDWEYQGKICSQGSYGKGPKGCDRRETNLVELFQVSNLFGLVDLHGNVREWCADYWHHNYENAPTDGSAWTTESDDNKRVLRGGSWNSSPKKCRSAYRLKFAPEASMYDIGFRIVCSPFDNSSFII